MPRPYNHHKLFHYDIEGDLIRSSCYGCPWESEWFDTKKQARDAQIDHDLGERLKK